MFIKIIFWFCLLALVHAYLFFPLILSILSKRRKENQIVYAKDDDLPFVSILIAAFNEEAVIGEKIMSILRSDYPAGKFEILIGSDGSTDETNRIIRDFQKNHHHINFRFFPDRIGKPSIINQLGSEAKGEVFILTDANVFFDKQTIFELVKHYKNPSIALVDCNMVNQKVTKDGISIQESTYINYEVKVKYYEGLIWGTMMGPFGGCFSIRGSFFQEVPPKFIVDDFYINMKVLEKGGRAMNELDAKCYEDVSNEMQEEYRRKVRISSGNFQNLFHFSHLLFSPINGLSFCWISHKVIRWFGPILLILLYLCSGLLSELYNFYEYVFIFQSVLLLMPVLDYLLKHIQIHLNVLRFVTYFYLTNFALLIGLLKFIGGIRTNVWQPTKRIR